MLGLIIDGEALQTNGKISLGGLTLDDEPSLHFAFPVQGWAYLQLPGSLSSPSLEKMVGTSQLESQWEELR